MPIGKNLQAVVSQALDTIKNGKKIWKGVIYLPEKLRNNPLQTKHTFCNVKNCIVNGKTLQTHIISLTQSQYTDEKLETK